MSQMPSAHIRLNGNMNSSHSTENTATSTAQGLYRDGIQSNTDWPQQQQQENPENVADNPFGPAGRQGGVSLFPQSGLGQSSGTLLDREDQFVKTEAARIAHQQEQRGVSHLSNAVSAVTTSGLNRNPAIQSSPSGGPVAGLGQMAAGLSSVGSALTSGNQLGLEKRGPVEFNHAIGYVNKIKASSATIYHSLIFLSL